MRSNNRLIGQNPTKRHKKDRLRSTNAICHQFRFPQFYQKHEIIFIKTFKV